MNRPRSHLTSTPSEDTATRARDAGIELLDSDDLLVSRSGLILSVVPPRDAVATAQRIVDALPSSPLSHPLNFVDLNAVSPTTATRIASLFERTPVNFIDGCILGGPPRQSTSPDPGTNGTSSLPGASGWITPSFPTSGPASIADIPALGPRLAPLLGESHISPAIGAASGLKMCFASLSKGLTAIAVQSFTTAHRLGVLPQLRGELKALLPDYAQAAERAIVTMPPKAYRWIHEMEEISATHRDVGGFADEAIFRGAAGVYRTVAEDSVLGQEQIGKRKRGTTLEDVAEAVAEGLDRKKKKTE